MIETGIWVIAICEMTTTILTLLDYFCKGEDDNE